MMSASSRSVGTPIRKSRRLSGGKPDLSLSEAINVIDSPCGKSRSRKRSVSVEKTSEDIESQENSKSHLNMEAIPEEVEDKKSDHDVEEDKNENAVTTEIVDLNSKEAESAQEIASKEAKSVNLDVKKDTEDKENGVKPDAKKSGKNKKSKGHDTLPAIPVAKGKRVSGRFWKSERDRFNNIIHSKGSHKSYQQRQKQKEEIKRAKALEKAMKEEKLRKIEDLKRRQEENKKRREENERKAEIVQVIKNPAKIKRMKKKQLRRIAKRDTTVVQKDDHSTKP